MRYYVNLPRHLMTKQKMNEVDAKVYRSNMGLNKQRTLKPEADRKCKARAYTPLPCPMQICNQKRELRLDNHLRQFHRLETESVRSKMQEARLLMNSNR